MLEEPRGTGPLLGIIAALLEGRLFCVLLYRDSGDRVNMELTDQELWHILPGRQGQEDSIPPITYRIKVSLIVNSDGRVNPEFVPFTAHSLFIAQKLDASRPNQPAQHNTG